VRAQMGPLANELALSDFYSSPDYANSSSCHSVTQNSNFRFDCLPPNLEYVSTAMSELEARYPRQSSC
jgi:hypothetical protein